MWPRRRHWFLGAGVGLALGLLLFLLTSTSESSPALRVASSGDSISALIVDGQNRLLILNAAGPRDARSVIGDLSRPWEDRPATIIVGADRNIVEGLWEAIERLDPKQIIVAGAPGDEPDWAEIEAHCRDAGIDIRYLDANTFIESEKIQVKIAPPGLDGSARSESYVEVVNGDARLAIGLGGMPDTGRYHAAITDGGMSGTAWADVFIGTGSGNRGTSGKIIVLNAGERIDILIESGRLEFVGRAARIATPSD